MTLEEYFYSFEDKPDCFPGKHNYVSAYKSFKDFMNNNVHKEIKSITMIKDDGTLYLNDHSAEHVQMVMEKVSRILWSGETPVVPLEPFECFILLSAIEIHDAGHVVNGRVDHAKNSKEFLKKYDYIVGSPEKKIIYDIARAHSGKDDPIGKIAQSEVISDFQIKTRMLAALLRLGDEMADETSRASRYLFEENQIIEGSRLFHAFSLSLISFLPHIDSHEVRMKFNLNKDLCNELFKKQNKDGVADVYLLDEIYERTFKTFHECLYYNRFVPDTIRLNTVNVTVDFYDEDFEPFFPSIKYRLEEKGYPHVHEGNIYALCGMDLERDGQKLNGEYVKSKIDTDGKHE